MKKSLVAISLLIVAAAASAQGTKAPADAKAPAAKAPAPGAKAPAAGAKAPDSKAADTKTQGTKAADTKSQGTATKSADAKAPAGQATGTKVAGPQRPGAAAAPAPAPVVQTPTIMRELYAYTQDSRRDPFISLLTSAELRPTVADLRLTGILYDETGKNSYATMRDLVTDQLYRVTTGQVLGRMRVALIKRTVVLFSIEEFGLNRQDSLFLGDTTKVRAR